MTDQTYDYDVIVAGAGPVGLCLSIDLGRRGIKTLIMEKDPTTAPWPKMDRSNARTMELFRRIGIADRVRALGYPPEIPMNIYLTKSLMDAPTATLHYPSVAERRAQVAETRDGSFPLEPYQLVSQNKVEPLLKEVAENETPNTDVRYGCALAGFEQDADGVTVHTELLDGTKGTLRAKYLVGCDGGSSLVRKTLGIKLNGRAAIRQSTQVIFWSEDLYEKMKVGKGRHFQFLDPRGFGFVAQGDRKEWTMHTILPVDTDFEPIIRKLIGSDDIEFTIRHVVPWRPHLLLADKYGEGRVFMAGDAIHLVIPNGGLGMNTGVGDAFDLSWKLAGTLQGWGGEGLLEGYEQERRAVGARNIEASGWASDGVPIWMAKVRPEAETDTPEGAANREIVKQSYEYENNRMHGMVGAEWGYSYAGSPLIWPEPGNMGKWQISKYEPSGKPGVRIPHMWLKDGQALQDVLGDWYTILDLKGDMDTAPLEAALTAIGAPFEVKRMDEPELRHVYNANYLLLRPDLHIAWRGDEAPADAEALAKVATGHGPKARR